MIRDLRKYSQQTGFRLVIGFFALVFLLGDGLIYLIYGEGPALVGLICLAGALVPVIMIVVILALIEWIAKRANQE